MAAGSNYLITLDQRPDPDAIQALRARGLGLRRHEGFGSLIAVIPGDPVRAAAASVFALFPEGLSAAARGGIAAHLRQLGEARVTDPRARPSSPLEQFLQRGRADLVAFLNSAVGLTSDELIALAAILEEES